MARLRWKRFGWHMFARLVMMRHGVPVRIDVLAGMDMTPDMELLGYKLHILQDNKPESLLELPARSRRHAQRLAARWLRNNADK